MARRSRMYLAFIFLRNGEAETESCFDLAEGIASLRRGAEPEVEKVALFDNDMKPVSKAKLIEGIHDEITRLDEAIGVYEQMLEALGEKPAEKAA